MTGAVIAFTRRGAALGKELTGLFEKATLHVPPRLGDELGEASYESLSGWTAEYWGAEALVFIGACGIAVRAIAPHVRDKLTDPCVVCVDEGGQFAVPILSGHVGGGNDLARRVAACTGGTAVVTTATDVNGRFSVDQWAARQGLHLGNRGVIKAISAALLEGREVGFASDFPWEGPLPDGVGREGAQVGFAVTLDPKASPFPQTLRLSPPVLALGVGCRRGTAAAAIAGAVDEALARGGLAPEAVYQVCTIDRKGDEAGLVEFCRSRGLPLVTYSAEELAAVPGEFTPSLFVEKTVGVDNVCERSALAGGGRLLMPKQAGSGVTVAVAQRPYTVRFDKEEAD